jgi:hypothetical protein
MTFGPYATSTASQSIGVPGWKRLFDVSITFLPSKARLDPVTTRRRRPHDFDIGPATWFSRRVERQITNPDQYFID